MTFNSLQYFVLLIVVFLVYRQLRQRGQNTLLLIASYVFYGAWDWRFLSLLWISTGVDFLVGRAMGKAEDDRHRRRLLLISLATNLGILATFKYLGFFIDSFVGLMDQVGLDATGPAINIVLPVGISFYTFQTLSYTIDIYRRRMEATDDLLAFAVYVAFFPQLIAGPIERAQHLLPQFLIRRDNVHGTQLLSGVHLIVLGLVKKVAIADAVAPFVNTAFDDAAGMGGIDLFVAVIAFGLQIYGDFSGYSDIARGSARVLGIDLMRNFEQPYLSTSITEFWRRWHISLSTWLRDYLYIPLGGNRGSRFDTARNLMVTMLLGGLWHGAAWTFVIWGALHGGYLLTERLLRVKASDDSGLPTWRTLPAMAFTWFLVHLAWVFFRSDGLGEAFDVLVGMATFRSGSVNTTAISIVVPALLVTLVIDVTQRVTGSHSGLSHWRPIPRGIAYGLGILALLVFSGQAPVPFIYFQF